MPQTWDKVDRDKKRERDKRFYENHRRERIAATVKCKKPLRLRLYGLSQEQWTAMFEAQGKCCACCGATEPGSKVGWHTDHDHKTNVVRGILCHHCNTALGLVKDSITVLGKMIVYLERFVEQRASRSKAT